MELVKKTYKLFINGEFVRSESGRYFKLYDSKNNLIANIPRASKKDLRNSVQASRQAQRPWQDRSAFNRSQIIYRIGEMLEQEKDRFVQAMIANGMKSSLATKEFRMAVDLIVHFAGWCDKYIQIASTVNPVMSSHFNFSIPEPVGVVCSNNPSDTPLIGIIKSIIPAICGGNTITCVGSYFSNLLLDFSEVLSNSDIPPGVVNIITGFEDELLAETAKHMDIDALCFWDLKVENQINITELATENMKRTNFLDSQNPLDSFKLILNFQEIKTTWHPIDRIKGSASAY